MDAILGAYFNLETFVRVYPLLVDGLLMTLKLISVCVPLGIFAGLSIAVLYALRIRALNILLVNYVDLMRAFPLLVLMILIFNGLPFLGVRLDPFTAAVVAFVLNSSGFYGEIFRAGIESIPAGQKEAGRSTGLTTFQTMAYIILPQAIRSTIPPLTTNTIEVIKGTTVASAVALPELLRSSRIAQGLVFNPTPLVAAALIYLILLLPLVLIVSRYQRQMMVPK